MGLIPAAKIIVDNSVSMSVSVSTGLSIICLASLTISDPRLARLQTLLLPGSSFLKIASAVAIFTITIDSSLSTAQLDIDSSQDNGVTVTISLPVQTSETLKDE